MNIFDGLIQVNSEGNIVYNKWIGNILEWPTNLVLCEQ